MLDTARGLLWLKTTLNTPSVTSLAPGGIWSGLAPEGTATPFVVVSVPAGNDVLTLNAHRVYTWGQYLIKVSAPSAELPALVAAADAIDALLKRTNGATVDAAIMACYREQPILLEELVGGQLWYNGGGYYHVDIQPLAGN